MRYRFKGMKEYVEKLTRLSNPFNTEACIDIAVDKGSKVVAEYTKKELENMPVDNRPYVKDGMRAGVTQKVKNELIKAFGVTPLANDNGFINKKTGVDRGYNGVATRKYPHGQPHVVIARSLEKGTSFMPKNPVFSRASRKARKPCLEAMEKSLNESIEAICLNNLRRSRVK